jgi:hypothetical protein
MARPKNAYPVASSASLKKEKTTILLEKALKEEAKASLKRLKFQTLTQMIEHGLKIQLGIRP